jgi:hypothetical protein
MIYQTDKQVVTMTTGYHPSFTSLSGVARMIKPLTV